MKINRYNLSTLPKEKLAQILRRSEINIEESQAVVQPIIKEVSEQGDEAVIKYTEKFDGVRLTIPQLKATEAEFAEARKTLDPALKEAIDIAAANIKKFHEAQMPEEMWFTQIGDGIMAGEKITPITSIGLYVPRGKGSFPSVMLMLSIPAVTAKVPKIVVCTPPTSDGKVDDASLYAAEVSGITEVYKVGGAQAIAALAIGTQTIPKVDKVIGPGNTYVTAAKRLLYGKIDVGTPAGPSESIILCDEHVNPKIAASDLLIEAEHGPDSTALLVTHSEKVADEVARLLPDLIAALPEKRRKFCESVFANYGGIMLTSSLEASVQFVNDFAPEHLEVLVKDPMGLLPKIVNAGEILLGEHSPITIGNFSLGVNAILPTGGFARTFSCVTVFDFLKRSSIGYLTREGFDKLGEVSARLADYEGFPAHANAIRMRK